MDCPFCKNEEVKHRTIIENDLAFAFPTNTPIVSGHILVCPKRHIQYYEDTTSEEKNAIENLRGKLKPALKRAFGAEGFNYAWNEEKIGGQSVSHFHLHIVPRKEGDVGIYQYEPREFLYRPGPRTVASPQEEIDTAIKAIKQAL
ncbi:MAG: HIT family protein [Candidatus Zambryskibacteria bacterium]|nr:HIT family protein [Candidatus Zambryskibacteria bacterium]